MFLDSNVKHYVDQIKDQDIKKNLSDALLRLEEKFTKEIETANKKIATLEKKIADLEKKIK